MFGSGQWTIWEGYAATKLMQGRLSLQQSRPERPPLHGVGGHGVHAHLRHGRADGLLRRFRGDRCIRAVGLEHGGDAPDAVDAGGGPPAQRLPRKVAVLSTFEHRSFDLADFGLVFKPQTDLAILNYIANHIITTDRVNKEFVNKHTVFKRGQTDIGYGLRPDNPAESGKGDGPTPRPAMPIDISSTICKIRLGLHYGKSRRDCPACRQVNCEELAELYADPKIKVCQPLDHGLQPAHARRLGNNLVYNLHLLTGKIAEPGNSPFSLTGQPSACGTAREVGTFSHRLPADMVVDQPGASQTRPSKSGSCRRARLRRKPGYHAVLQNRMLQAMASSTPTGFRSTTTCRPPPNLNAEGYPGYRNPDNFIVVSDAYPTVTAHGRRSRSAYSNVGRKGRRLRQCGTAHAILASARDRTGRRALGSLAADGVLQALQYRRGLACRSNSRKSPNTKAKRCSMSYSKTVWWTNFHSRISRLILQTTNPRPSDFMCRKAYLRNMPNSAAATDTTSRRLTAITKHAVCAGRSLTARRRFGVTEKAAIPT